ncbi:hypothetical protein RFI_10574 [Reticulomyxa filosa]|uniref:Uncharacterized protein n=1 Tax=Reticulomyxa filosa TaxID=46433 RepID=X6NKW7_RETFI|nr:hypothetical protein RFI_10574 [Reticulomyxa filosa]|eukprot:ETO26563.1 hypothetical protein RFI_10574 [Reticulomyxa filosa]
MIKEKLNDNRCYLMVALSEKKKMEEQLTQLKLYYNRLRADIARMETEIRGLYRQCCKKNFEIIYREKFLNKMTDTLHTFSMELQRVQQRAHEVLTTLKTSNNYYKHQIESSLNQRLAYFEDVVDLRLELSELKNVEYQLSKQPKSNTILSTMHAFVKETLHFSEGMKSAQGQGADPSVIPRANKAKATFNGVPMTEVQAKQMKRLKKQCNAIQDKYLKKREELIRKLKELRLSPQTLARWHEIQSVAPDIFT